MRTAIAWPLAAVVLLAGGVAADTLKEGIKVRIDSTETHSGMAPGTFVCAAGHLHVKGTVENLAGVPVGRVEVAGRVFDADGKLLDTATASTKARVLNPNEKATVNLEFLKITGPLVDQAKDEQLEVVAVETKP
jgi:hypothetical protein